MDLQDYSPLRHHLLAMIELMLSQRLERLREIQNPFHLPYSHA